MGLPVKSLAFATSLAIAGCAAQSGVERRYDGEVLQGRPISASAYAYYARGAVLEAQGSYDEAAAEYRAVLELDGRSVSAWTQLGACLCAQGRPADAAFDHALRLGRHYAPAWHEQAKCLERRGEYTRALGFAERALSLKQDEFEYTATVARLLERLGEDARARRLLIGSVLWQPGSIESRRALAGFGVRKRDPVLVRMSCCLTTDTEPFSMHRPPGEAVASRSSGAPPGEDQAQPRAPTPRMVERALCAARRGDGDAAMKISRVIVDLDPDNADAWVALLCGADLLGDSAAFSDALARIGSRPVLTYRLARDLMADVLERRSGEASAAAWATAWDAGASENDDLQIDCEHQQPRGSEPDVPSVGAL